MPNNPFYRSKFWFKLRAQALKRDNHTCTTPGCGQRATIVDHIKTRPNVTHPTEFDVIDNLRSVCRRCDGLAKERPGGNRKEMRAVGCNPDGTPKDTTHSWYKS